jgi:TonB family protein
MTVDLVSGIVVTRSREPEGLLGMMMASSIAHAAAIAALVTASSVLRPHQPAEDVPMQISLPDMPGPVRSAAPAPAPRKPSTPAKPAPPATAPAMRPASRPVDSDATSNEGGLALRFLPGTNARATNVSFCDPEYLGQMVALIHRNWQQHQQVAGRPIVRFAIQRDGTLTGITLRQPSGHPGLDLAAMRAVTLTRAIPPLPACYPHPQYAMNLTFDYIR